MTKDELVSYVLNSPENTNPNVFKSLLDVYVSENGGGSSENSNFSTATLTVTNIGEDKTAIVAHGIFIVDDTMVNVRDISTTEEITVLLYKGVQEGISFDYEGSDTISGNITQVEFEYTITGNCTFTAAGYVQGK